VSFPHHKSWADVGEFIKQRVEVAKNEHDHTATECVYAHFRRWAFLRGEGAVSAEVFDVRFSKAMKLQSYKDGEFRFYPVLLKDPPTKDDDDLEFQKPKGRVVRGQVRILRAMQFHDNVIQVGTVLDWMESSDYEKQNIERMTKDAGNRAMSWLIVEFKGTRRYVPATNVERV
jgi:hypothetical protein